MKWTPLNVTFFEPKLEQCDILSLFWGSRLIKIRCKVDLYVLECHFFLLWHTSGQKLILIPFILYMVIGSKKNKIYVKLLYIYVFHFKVEHILKKWFLNYWTLYHCWSPPLFQNEGYLEMDVIHDLKIVFFLWIVAGKCTSLIFCKFEIGGHTAKKNFA